jgi:hypothetical protein
MYMLLVRVHSGRLHFTIAWVRGGKSVNKLKLTLLLTLGAIAVALYKLEGSAFAGLFCAVVLTAWCFVRSSATETRKIRDAAQESADSTNALRSRELAERNR